MNMKLSWVVIVICIVFMSYLEAYACVCDIPTVCQAYSRADSVFTGKLVNLKKMPESARVVATFEVDETFKGKTGKIEIIPFRGGDCGPQLILGERHFVYKDSSAFEFDVCNLTTPLSKTRSDLDHVNSLSKNSPTFQIWGRVTTEATGAKVVVSNGRTEVQVPLDQHGFFKFIAKEENKYVVRVVFPEGKKIFMKVLGNGFHSAENFVEYSLQFKPNECDFREFELWE